MPISALRLPWVLVVPNKRLKTFVMLNFHFDCSYLFTGQFNTEYYVTFTDVMKSIGESTSCSSHIIFIYGAKQGATQLHIIV